MFPRPRAEAGSATAAPLAWSRTFPATAAQVREARRFLASVLDGCAAADDAILCLSELVTNAAVHSRSREPGGHFAVRATIGGGHLRVEVRDNGGPWILPVRSPGGQHGRGLLPAGEMTMTEPGPAASAQYDTQLLRAMAADLAAHGLTTHLTDSRAGLDLTAPLSPSGRREAELIIDEDGYAELRYWIPVGTPPAEVTAAALRALTAVTGTAPNPGRHPE